MSTATFGTANHPFRATLPLRVLRRLPQFEPEVQARMDVAEQAEASVAQEPAPRSGWRITVQDVKDFLIAYIACFMAVSAWLS